MEVQGYVVIGMTLLLLGYLLPHLVRSRQIQLDSRVGDRFSADLRILATAGSPQASAPPSSDGDTRGCATRPTYLHDPHRRPEAPAVNRPQTRGAAAPQDARALAAARAARAARVSRRVAAARRRLLLTVVLLLLTAGAWAGVALAVAPWFLAPVPTILLAAVLVLGRQTAQKGRANDRRDRERIARLEDSVAAAVAARPAAPARPARPATARVLSARPVTSGVEAAAPSTARPAEGEDDVELASRGDDVEAPAAAHVDTASEDSAVEPAVEERAPLVVGADWTPVPVPVPSYTLKPSAPRRDVAAYEESEAAPSAAVPQRPTAPSPAAAAAALGEPTAPPLDLDRVLARRRAAGE